MPDNNYLATLQARLAQLEEERAMLERLVAFALNHTGVPPLTQKINATSYSVRGRVVDAIIEMIHKVGKQVGNKEILEMLQERGISLGDTKNKESMLAAILSQEVRKKSARLKKVARGVYDIKQ